MTYTAEMISIIRNWYERERVNWKGWNLYFHKEAGENDDIVGEDGEIISSWLDGIATLQHVNDAGEDISDEYDTVIIQNTGQVSVNSSYDERMPLLDARQLRGLAELSESIEHEIARQKGDKE